MTQDGNLKESIMSSLWTDYKANLYDLRLQLFSIQSFLASQDAQEVMSVSQ